VNAAVPGYVRDAPALAETWLSVLGINGVWSVAEREGARAAVEPQRALRQAAQISDRRGQLPAEVGQSSDRE